VKAEAPADRSVADPSALPAAETPRPAVNGKGGSLVK
jgi:hypothetical protein